MKKEWIPAVLMTLVCLVLVNGLYTGIVWGIAQVSPQHGDAERIAGPNGQRYYVNIGQRFTEDRYFWGRPSVVDYNAAGSGGSNKGPSNPDYLATVAERIDSFMAHNPGVKKSELPSELVTASSSGLDPDISIEAAMVQIPRIITSRGIPADALRRIIASTTDRLPGNIGPATVNLLRLNLALDELSSPNVKH